ncbi:hypothetical protein, conserved [Eimeria brunetti]|uniref:Uncharacterized protein n=1 Tax=Eimeria brunetti TaxID=51314 RepID=U6LP48_9EIME|nr:hypothetical protein, conserved [Eimeria brunetti]
MKAACCFNKEPKSAGDGSSIHPQLQPTSRSRKVTFLINLPCGGTSVASVSLEDLPLLTAAEAQRLATEGKRGASPVERLATSTCIQASSCGLYVPGHFLLSLAAARAGFHVAEAASKLRLLVQQKEVYPHTSLPLETVIGTDAGFELAADLGFRVRAAADTKATAAAPSAPLCSLWLLLRLPGGKGGFGALLKKQRRRKRANFSIDACRDLTGRRIRQAQVVERLKAWMEKKKKEDALVAALTRGAEEKVPEAKPTVALDDAFIAEQLAQVSEMSSAVAQGLKQQVELRKKLEEEQRNRAAKPQNRAVFSQLREAVEVDSDDDDEEWTSDTDGDEECNVDEQDSTSSSSSSSSDNFSSIPSEARTTAGVSNKGTEGRAVATSSNSALASSSGASKYATGPASGKNGEKAAAESPRVDPAAAALMQQLEQMRLKASAEREKERQRQAEAAAEAARAAALAEKAAAEAAEKVAREARQLDVSRFNTAEELAKAVDAAVVKEKLRQLGWKCGGRPEERAARLLQLKTVDLSNVPKALLARPPSRMA